MTTRVLIADDAPGVRESVAIAVEAAGMEAIRAANGLEAMAIIGERPVDVLVADIWMPDLDGLNLIKQVRALRPDLRIIAMTGGGARLTIETASSLAEVWGAEWVFVKPFDEAALIARIRGNA
jgi:two-component system chemotaxis response regulator CheY